MSSATITAPQVEAVEEVEEVGEDSAKRGRGAAPDINYRKVFKSEDDCKSNPPSKTENGVVNPVEGFRIYVVGTKVTKDEKTGDVELKRDDEGIRYVWARNAEQAVAFVAGDNGLLSEPLEYGKRGKSASIDPVYCQFFDFLVEKWKMATGNDKTETQSKIETNLESFAQYRNYCESKGYVSKA